MKTRCCAAALLVMLGGCTTTTILESENPSRQRPPAWTEYFTLPVDLYGVIPAIAPQALAEAAPFPAVTAGPQTPQAGRRVVFFINPARLPPDDALCKAAQDFASGHQGGRYARVTGATCDGTTVATYAVATILTAGLTPAQIGHHLDMLHLQLYQALYPGNNHPARLSPQKLYGP